MVRGYDVSVSTDAILFYGIITDEEDVFQGKSLDVLEEAANGLGVEIVSHCSNECTMYAIAAKDSVLRANRGCPEKIEERHMNPTARGHRVDEWVDDLRKFFDKAGLDLSSLNPTWWLCSWWG